MTTIIAVIRNGQLELPRPLDLPDGTEVEIRLPELESPMSAEEIARPLTAMDKVEPFDLTDAERAEVEAKCQARKEWEKAHFEERAEQLRKIGE